MRRKGKIPVIRSSQYMYPCIYTMMPICLSCSLSLSFSFNSVYAHGLDLNEILFPKQISVAPITHWRSFLKSSFRICIASLYVSNHLTTHLLVVFFFVFYHHFWLSIIRNHTPILTSFNFSSAFIMFFSFFHLRMPSNIVQMSHLDVYHNHQSLSHSIDARVVVLIVDLREQFIGKYWTTWKM